MTSYVGCNPQIVGAEKDKRIAELELAWGDHLEKLRALRNHWNEFGPEHGFERTLEAACEPIDINKGVGSVTE